MPDRLAARRDQGKEEDFCRPTSVTERMLSGDSTPEIVHIYGTHEIIMFMKQESIRTTVDIPAPLYRKLEEQAAGTGSSIRELVLLGVRRVVLGGRRPRPKRVEFPLIVSKGPQVDLTNEQLYEHVEFP
jgi:hypothetical protein